MARFDALGVVVPDMQYTSVTLSAMIVGASRGAPSESASNDANPIWPCTTSS